jgi:hypothetical protein
MSEFHYIKFKSVTEEVDYIIRDVETEEKATGRDFSRKRGKLKIRKTMEQIEVLNKEFEKDPNWYGYKIKEIA